MTLLVIVTLATLAISGTCSLFEAVLYSSRMGTLEAARRSHPKDPRTELMIGMKKEISKPIAAILILNTIANTAGATMAGVVSAQVLPPRWVTVYTGVLVLAILFLSEIIPKTFGAVHWRGLWRPIVYPLVAVKTALLPFVAMAQWVTSKLTHQGSIPSITEEEIIAMVQLGATEGHITQSESRLVRNIIQMEDKQASTILTPRIVMFTLDQSTPIRDAIAPIQEAGFTRIPIYDKNPEDITGYVLRRDIYETMIVDAPGGDTPLSAIAKPITFVPESANCLVLLNRFLKTRRHLAMVTDEYGGLAGLITLEDLLETLLGSEIVDESDKAIDMRSIARNWKTEQNGSANGSDTPTS